MNTPPPIPATEPAAFAADREAVDRLLAGRATIEAELSKAIVGQKEVIEQILLALFAGGHCLITGAPGLAKTLLVKSIAEILQEASDGRKMTFVQGPVFANMVLADEINRTPPKTQAALLEAMQEHQV